MGEREEKKIAVFLFVSLSLSFSELRFTDRARVITTRYRHVRGRAREVRGDAYLAQAFLFIFCKYSE